VIVGAFDANLSSKSKAGKSYVVFGKTDNTAINLSAIASGTGGFVINGENADDYSGNSVSSAGDVNGDGLDDVIVGAWGADPSNESKAGKSYVIFGKTDNTAIKHRIFLLLIYCLDWHQKHQQSHHPNHRH
jgi:hypothetical protein